MGNKMKKTIKKKIEHKKEIFISTLALAVVSFTLMSLKSPIQNNSDLNASKKEASTTPSTSHIKDRKPASPLKAKKTSNKIKTFEDKMKYTLSKLEKIELCFEKECTYPDNDPLEYSLSVYKDLSLRIEKYKNFWAASWDKIPDSQKQYLVGMLAHDDGFVKKEVLSLIAKLPPEESSKYLDLVLKDVIAYHDSKLIPEALKFIANTKTTQNEVKVSQSLSVALKQGGPHVSQEISKNIGRFISPKTADLYSKILPHMPKSAPETVYLSSALTEYEMKQSGG